MSPRSYRMGQRQAEVDETRARIVAAARAQLTESGALSLDAVARRADVARATVYYQYKSRVGLLEALCDALAAEGGMARLAEAFGRPDPWTAVDRFVEVMAGFWSVDPACTRRLRALGALDEEVGRVIAERDARRRQGASVLAGRLPDAPSDAAALLYILTSFETFDALASETPSAAPGDPSREAPEALEARESLEAAVPAVTRLARAALGAPGAPGEPAG
ncbi:TetR/AcrR family transcriptional regulator [Streptomyces sp. NRRL WC-3742]|uniref:TetR/AcrR family transcriptional regulator n=1 Tax=Streptomyces sp. NRRL WC-3742 TaxID=1463934 RepID=UPI000691B85A|nr:TetR family transcriptional regulator [Streptomyces sp. NRRL WC-3742]